MEPTEAAEAAVWRVLEQSEMNVVERQVVFDAVRAAFAAVPDPLPDDVREDIQRMVNVHRGHRGAFDGTYPMVAIAARVDAFMRGDGE